MPYLMAHQRNVTRSVGQDPQGQRRVQQSQSQSHILSSFMNSNSGSMQNVKMAVAEPMSLESPGSNKLAMAVAEQKLRQAGQGFGSDPRNNVRQRGSRNHVQYYQQHPQLPQVQASRAKMQFTSAVQSGSTSHGRLPGPPISIGLGSNIKTEPTNRQSLNFQQRKIEIEARDHEEMRRRKIGLVLRAVEQKPFACPVCNERFSQLETLKDHVREGTHNTSTTSNPFSLRPFVCPLCSKSFDNKYNLKRHMMIHTGEKPFECEVCGRRFNQRSTYNHHKRRMH